MRVLIVGCGYIGLALAEELACQGHDVVGLRRTAPPLEPPASGSIKLISADITDRAQVGRLPAEYDWVVNCAATRGGGVESYRHVYLEGMTNLVEWLSPAPPLKFIYTSSTGVYGQTDGSVVNETSITDPASETARILVQAERVLLDAAISRNFPTIALRVAGIYGPGRGYWLQQLLSGAAQIEGEGTRVLNMIHRTDVVGAIMAALLRGRPGEVYNAVDDDPVPQLVLLQWLSNRLGKPLPPKTASTQPERKRGLTDKKVSNLKLKQELGYQFRYPSFREGYEAEISRLDGQES